MDAWTLLSDVVMLLAAALLLGGIFARLGQSPLVGYILAGMILGGPGSIQVVRSQQAIEGIAELGVSLLLFSLGLEFAWSELKKLGLRTLMGGVLQVVLTTILGAIGAAVAGLGFREAVAVGAMVSLSSTAVVLRLLVERAEGEAPHGRNSLAVLLVQDMAVVPLALLVALLGGDGGLASVATNAGKILLLAAGVVVVSWVVVTKIAVRALASLTLERNRELTNILAVAMGLGSAWAAHAIGVSPALGAFVAGMFLGGSPFATQIRADIASLRVVLLTLFFGAAGMVADPLWMLAHLPLVLGISVLLLVGKASVIWGIFRAIGQATPIAIATGLCLAQIGEFAFVLGSIARAAEVITAETYLLIVSVTIVTLIISPLLIPRAPWLGMRIASLFGRSGARALPSRDGVTIPPDVVMIGFGPAGRIAANSFVGGPERVLVIDLNHAGVRAARTFGFEGHVGDATQTDVLEHARVDGAKAVIITIPHHRSAVRILEQVRRLAPHAHTVVRSRYQQHNEDFVMAGAHVVVGDEEQVGDTLGRHLAEWLESSGRPKAE